MQQSIKPKNPEKIPDNNRSGVYKLTCMTCSMSDIGQTSWDLTQRYREHIRYIRNNDPHSAYAQHILRNQHEYGTITDTTILLKPIHKTSLLIPYEQFFIQTHQYNGTVITEQNRGEQNPLFELAIDTGLTSQLFHNKWIPTVRYTWISSNSTTRADGSRSGYVKNTLLISIVLFPKYFTIKELSLEFVTLQPQGSFYRYVCNDSTHGISRVVRSALLLRAPVISCPNSIGGTFLTDVWCGRSPLK